MVRSWARWHVGRSGWFLLVASTVVLLGGGSRLGVAAVGAAPAAGACGVAIGEDLVPPTVGAWAAVAGWLNVLPDAIEQRVLAAGGLAGGCQKMIVPIYPSNTGYWDEAVASGMPPGSILILNTGGSAADDPTAGLGGPGLGPDAAMQQRVRDAQYRGYIVLAYVRTGGAGSGPGPRRDEAAVRLDLANAAAWYGVDGVYVDEVYTSTENFDYYRAVVAEARRFVGGLVALNPGGVPDRAYVDLADIVVTYEGDYAAYRDVGGEPRWLADFPPERFAQQLLSVPDAPTMQQALAAIRRHRTGYVYVTSEPAARANEYSLLPDYWAEQVAAVVACRR